MKESLCNTNKDLKSITWLGQAGFVFKSSGGYVLTIDPYLSDCVEDVENDHIGYKRLLPPVIAAKNLKTDCLICTHFHRDHFDIDSIPFIMENNDALLLCPQDCYNDICNLKLSNYEIIKPGYSTSVKDFNIHFIECDHGTGAPFAVGLIIEFNDKRVLIIGDSCLRLDRINEYLSYGNIDILIGPINGAYGNLNEDDLVILSTLLKPSLVIPCHYGMFKAHGGDVEKFVKLIEKTSINYKIMKHGEVFTF